VSEPDFATCSSTPGTSASGTGKVGALLTIDDLNF
jgi:hypothetical protein